MGIENLIAETGLTVIFIAVIAGALFEVESYYVGMALISQPIITGAIAGMLFGDIATGISVGCVIQLIWLSPPVGAYVPPSSSAIAFVTASAGIIMMKFFPQAPEDAVMMYSMLGGAAAGYFIGQMDIWNRKFNTVIMHRFEGGIKEGKEFYMHMIQGIALSAKLLRDCVVFGLIFFVGIPIFMNIFPTLPEQFITGFRIAYWMMPALGFASVFVVFRVKGGGVMHGTVLLISYVLFRLYSDINIFFFLLLVAAAGLLIIYNMVWKGNRA